MVPVLVVVEVGEQGGQVGLAEGPDRHPRLLVVTGGPDAVRVRVRLPGHGGLLVVPAGGPFWARPAQRRVPPSSGKRLILLVAVDRGRAGRRTWLGLAVAVGAALAAPDPG